MVDLTSPGFNSRPQKGKLLVNKPFARPAMSGGRGTLGGAAEG